MKKRKFGFTVAEVAISMTILGVIAAMTMPMIVGGVQKRQSAVILGRAVEQITLGCQNMIQLANANSTDGSSADVLSVLTVGDITPGSPEQNLRLLERLERIVPSFWGLENGEANDIEPEIRDFLGRNNVGANFRDMIGQGSRINFSNISASVSIVRLNENNPPSDLDAVLPFNIFIDTTGWDRGPNMFGRDIFLFRLVNNGTLMPFSEGDTGLERTVQVVRDGFRITYY